MLAINETIFVSHKGYADWKIDIIKWLLYFLDTRFSDNPPMKWNEEKKRNLVCLLKHPVSDAMPIAYYSLTYSSSIERNGGAPA